MGFYINRIKVHNFKSFQDLDISLDRYNVVIGKNGTGKSNFSDIFEFLSDVSHDLTSAIHKQGGRDILNYNSKDNRLSFEVYFSSNVLENVHIEEKSINQLHTNNIIYKFCIEFKEGKRYDIVEDCLNIIIGDSHIEISKDKYIINVDSNLDIDLEIFDYFMTQDDQLLISDSLLYNIIPNWYDFIRNMSVYRLDPIELKKPTIRKELTRLCDGNSSLSYILDDIIYDEKEYKRFINHVQDLLPFVKDVGVQYIDGNATFNVTIRGNTIPMQSVSDGTICVIGLVVGLLFDDSLCTVIKDPERNIHASILDKLVDLFQDESELHQVVVITHNTDIVECSPIENVLVIDESGITKLKDHDMVKTFEDSMSVSELMRQGLL